MRLFDKPVQRQAFRDEFGHRSPRSITRVEAEDWAARVAPSNPQVQTAFESPQDTTGQTAQPPPDLPTFCTSTRFAGTAYLYGPSQLAIVRRQDATVEVDRSRLFNSDETEVRGKMRVSLVAPHPTAIVRLTAGTA